MGDDVTIEELILSIEVELEQATKRRDRAVAEVKGILGRAKAEGRSNLTPEEDADVQAAFKTRGQAVLDIAGIGSKLENAKRVKQAEDETELALHERTADPKTTAQKPAYDRVARVGQEERTYNPRTSRKGGEFLRDVVRQFLYRDIESEQRLMRHMQEERVERGQYLERAAGTGAFAGLTVPQYLTDMYAPAVAALRPFADTCNHHDLPPDGMTVNISQITTATSVALQASENTGVSEANIDDTLLTENVQTAAGQQTLSRQAIDRGSGVEAIVMDDLFRRYATTLDSTLINQATTGLDAVAAGQTFTTPVTSVGTYSAMVGAAATVETTLLGWAQPDLVVMHPRRWYKLLSAVSATWPMIFGQNNAVPIQSTGLNNDNAYAQGIRGTLANGMGICVDANMSTVCLATAITGGTQDHILVVPRQEMHLWEDPAAPVFIRAEQTAAASLGVLLVLYGYFAYCFRRFPSGATVKINGVALVPPVFDGT